MRAYFHQDFYSKAPSISPGTVESSSDYMIRIRHESVSEICTKIIPAKVKEFGPNRISWLEIHSHGETGKICLGSDGVTVANVQAFGKALRTFMKLGGMIEILACLVAGGKVQLSSRLQMQMDIKKIAMGVPVGTGGSSAGNGGGRSRAVLLTPTSSSSSSRRRRPKGDPAKARFMNALYQTIYADPVLRQQHVGMTFCSQLAANSGCTVRAACWIQMEEDSPAAFRNTYSSGPVPTQHMPDGGYDRQLYTSIGHWEGPVYDFLPGGGLNYLGDGVKRFTPYRVLLTGSSTFA